METATAQRNETLRGRALLNDPVRNKGTAFIEDERWRFSLEGLLPASMESLERQVERVLGHLEAKPTDLERYINSASSWSRARGPTERRLPSMWTAR